MEKIRSFRDLDAWEEGHKLVVEIYKITKSFPKEKMFGLSTQLRRSAVSITSNIAEGFSRKSLKEKIQFYSMAKASNTELQNQLLIARDVGYLSKEKFQELEEQSIRVNKLISGLIRYCKK
ncbi:MAG: four helix bundle protein [archaeon YNP-LCB-024-027]|nr:four helix bundle protein [Candidatus Culexarchaeum yellowstonense]